MKLNQIFFLISIFFSINCFSQLKINNTGKVGINQSNPAYNLDVYGTARFWTTWGYLIFNSTGPSNSAVIYPETDWVGALGKGSNKFSDVWCYNINYDNINDWSDERLKENIKPLQNSLDKIKLLNAVSFNMKKEFYGVKDSVLLSKIMGNQKEDFGFIAQEVMDVIPELVVLDTATNYYLLNYVKLIPVLTQAIQELEGRIKVLENCCDGTINLKSGSAENMDIETLNAKLYQNAPNPFNVNTTIRFEVPESVHNCQLYILTATGTLLKTIIISQRGEGSIVISANEFNAGMYLYSLVIDEKIIDTKRMLLIN